MRKNKSFIIKGIIFGCIVGMIYHIVIMILIPKFFYDDSWPTSTTYLGFYEMEKESVDVLFLGSSHSVAAFNPQVLYDKYRIRSYNMGGDQQNMLMSYYWLKEALRFQKAKVVVLDCFMLYPYKKNVLNCEEPSLRKSIDFMRWSPVKVEAIEAICKVDDQQNRESFYFPNIRFHSRWKELDENDFSINSYGKQCYLKGYATFPEYSLNKEFQAFEKGSSADTEEPLAVMKEYLDKIVALCKEEGIELILTKTPATTQNIARYNWISKYAAEKELLFYEFNEKNIYDAIGYDFAVDNREYAHCNVWGAEKVTDFIGKVLQEECLIAPVTDQQWEETREYYEECKKDCELAHVTDIDEYTALIKDAKYSLLLVSNQPKGNTNNTDIHDMFSQLGLSMQADTSNYYAIVDNGQVIEKCSNDKISEDGSIRNGKEKYTIVCDDREYFIAIGGEEYTENKNGCYILVYNNERRKVVDWAKVLIKGSIIKHLEP